MAKRNQVFIIGVVVGLLGGLIGCTSFYPQTYELEIDGNAPGATTTPDGVVLTSVEPTVAVEASVLEIWGYGLVSTWIANLADEEFEVRPSDVMLVVLPPYGKLWPDGKEEGQRLRVYRGTDDVSVYISRFLGENYSGGPIPLEPPPQDLDGTIAVDAASSDALAAAADSAAERSTYSPSQDLSMYLMEPTRVPPLASISGGVGLRIAAFYQPEIEQTESPHPHAPNLSGSLSFEEAFADPAFLFELTEESISQQPIAEFGTMFSIIGPDAGAPPPRVRLYIRTGGTIHAWDLDVGVDIVDTAAFG